MSKTIELVRQEVDIIKNEVEDFANSASRIGEAMSDILEYNKELTETEANRAKDVEQSLSEEINDIKEAISNIGGEGGEGSKEVTRAEFELVEVQSKSTFEAFSKLGMTEKADADGYEIALAKATNTAEKTKVKVPVYDTQDPSKTPVGLVDEIFVEDMANMMDGKIDDALNGFTPDNIGYVILSKDKSFAEQVTKENTIYKIIYDFDLGGETVTVPSGCVLKFEGGTLKNGILSNDFKLDGDYAFSNVICNGTVDVEEIRGEKYQFDDETKHLYYLLRIKGPKRIVLEKGKEYMIDTETISDSDNTFVFVEGNKRIVGNGAVIVDSRGNSELLDKKGYFYLIRFNEESDISVEDLTFKTSDTTIEKIYEGSPEPETFGECFVLFTNCQNYAVKNCRCVNLSVGVTCNNSKMYNLESVQYPIEIEVDNVGYGLMVNGEGNINADIIARTHAHRIIYSGGARNCVYNIRMLGEISITAAGILLQEYWRLKEDGETYIYEQNKDIKIRIDCFGTLVKHIAGDIGWLGPLVSHGYYTSDVHGAIADKKNAFVMDGIDITVNYHKIQTLYAISFSSAIVRKLDYNVMVRGRIAVNLFEDVHEDDYDVFDHILVTSGTSGIYSNVDYDLDIDVYSQYGRTIGVRTTNLGKNSCVRINSNTNVSGKNWIDPVVEGHGLIEVDAPSYILAERTSNAAHIHMLRGYVDKSLYGSATGCASIRMNEGYVAATTATDTSDESYTTNIKKHNNIIIDITGNAFTMTYYEYFKNYSAKNETYSIILHNKGTSTTKITPKNFDVIKFPSPFYIDAGGQVMTEVKVIDGVTYFDVVSTVVACGTTAERPTAPYNGFEFYDKTLQRSIWWNGEAGRWINADGYAAGYRSGARRAELTDSLTGLDTGLQFYDTLLGKPVIWNGDSWEDLNGSIVD